MPSLGCHRRPVPEPSDNPDAFAPAILIRGPTGSRSAFCGGAQGDVDPCADDGAPQNWVYAQATWDTSTVEANTDWKFWVSSDGGERTAGSRNPDHGLRAIPASSLNSLADVAVETYSNNLVSTIRRSMWHPLLARIIRGLAAQEGRVDYRPVEVPRTKCCCISR